jgi:hypothetical protein
MTACRRTRSATMRLRSDPENVFPLLCPVRESEWIETWQCAMVHTESGRAELDCIFKTAFPSDGPEDVWVVSRYEPPRRIEFVRVNPLRVMHYTIALQPLAPGESEATWTQVLTGLNAEGDRFIQSMDDAAFSDRMAALEGMLNHYLKTGAMLRR